MTLEKEILDFKFDKALFASNNGISNALKNQIDLRCRKLERLNLANFGKAPSNENLQIVLLKFKQYRLQATKKEKYFNKREIRLLSHSLLFPLQDNFPIADDEWQLTDLLKLLNDNWSDSLIFGLMSGLLNGWNNLLKSCKSVLSNFIIQKLNEYDGNRKSIEVLKPLLRYLDSNNGDLLLGADFAELGIPISECASYINLPDSWVGYSFFSNVILSYYTKRKREINEFIDDLELVLKLHNNTRFNKIIISKLIVQVSNQSFGPLQDQIKRMAFNLIGDPDILSKWHPVTNAPTDHSSEIKQAVQILNQWIIQQFINVFFEKCINDPRRKRYWLKYANKITQFNVIGSSYTKRILLEDDRISEFVTSRYKTTRTGDDSAIMFVLKSHILVEFSDMGKLYAYKVSNPLAPSFNTKTYSNTSQLKLSFAVQNQLIYRTGRKIDSYSDEGSQPHHDGEMTWEEVFTKWINLKIGL